MSLNREGTTCPNIRNVEKIVTPALTWIPDSFGGFVLVADIFGGLTIAAIGTKSQGVDSAPLRWKTEGRPPQAGDAWSFTSALKAICKALPACSVPDLPAGVK